MTRSPLSDDDHALAGEYVLGTLPLAQRQEIEARLQHDTELQNAVAAWEEHFFPYTALVDPVPPSDMLWPRIQRSLAARQPTAGQTPPPPRRLWHNVSLWRGLAGASIAAMLIMGVLFATYTPPPGTPQYMVVLLAPQTQSAGWVVQAATPQEIQLIPLGPFEVPEGKALEFWTKADEWQAPVSLGLVEPGEPIRLSLDDLPPMEDNQLFELTLEEATGSPTGLPTGPIQFIGRAVEI